MPTKAAFWTKAQSLVLLIEKGNSEGWSKIWFVAAFTAYCLNHLPKYTWFLQKFFVCLNGHLQWGRKVCIPSCIRDFASHPSDGNTLFQANPGNRTNIPTSLVAPILTPQNSSNILTLMCEREDWNWSSTILKTCHFIFSHLIFKSWAVWQNENHSVSAKIRSSHALKIGPKLLPIHKCLSGETKLILTMELILGSMAQ